MFKVYYSTFVKDGIEAGKNTVIGRQEIRNMQIDDRRMNKWEAARLIVSLYAGLAPCDIHVDAMQDINTGEVVFCDASKRNGGQR